MHPPRFLDSHHLLEWPDCFLELHCCKGAVVFPVRALAQQRGNPTFATLLLRLRCSQCGAAPAPVYLCAGQHREWLRGPPADWALELVPKRCS